MIGRLLLAMLLTGCIASVVLAEEQFLVEFELWLDGELVGTPVLIVEAGEFASLEKMGEPHYRIEVLVEPSANSIMPLDMAWLHVTVEQLGSDGWEALVDSMMGAREGEPTVLAVTEDDRLATPEAASLYLQARTSRLKPGERAD